MRNSSTLAAIALAALMITACAETGGRPDVASRMLTGPTSFTVERSAGQDVSILAVRGGNGKSPKTGDASSLAPRLVTDANSDGVINWGDSLRFDVTTTVTSEPHVSLACSKNGVVVFGAVTGYYATYPWPWTQTMTLKSVSWQGGAATCTAKLYYIDVTNVIDLASMSFAAGA